MKNLKARGGGNAPTVYIVLMPLYEAGHLYDPGDEIMLTPRRASALRGLVRAPEDKMIRAYETK